MGEEADRDYFRGKEPFEMGDMADWVNENGYAFELEDGSQEDWPQTVLSPYSFDRIEIEREKSWLLVMGKENLWFPKSRCTLDLAEKKVWVPEWLARAKGIF
jgi:hypothetical protein